MGRYSSYIFATPTFTREMGSCLDLGGTMVDFNEVPTPEIADFLALRGDMSAIAADLRRAMKLVSSQERQKRGEQK